MGGDTDQITDFIFWIFEFLILWIGCAYNLFLGLLYKLETKDSLLSMQKFVSNGNFYKDGLTFCCRHLLVKGNILSTIGHFVLYYLMLGFLIYTIHYLYMLQSLNVISSLPLFMYLTHKNWYVHCVLFSEIYLICANESDNGLRSY